MQKNATKLPVIRQEWVESEFGQRPEGFSLHLTEAKRVRFVRKHETKNFRASGEPRIVDVNATIYEQVKAAGLGLKYA